jgi:hypothetical protein
MQFNINDYEPVQERIAKFYAIYTDGRIITDLVGGEKGIFIFKATLYKSGDDYKNGIVLSTGWAREIEGQGFVNKTSALENAETSAIGRALANIGLHGDKRPSREEMQKTLPEIDLDKFYSEMKNKISAATEAKVLVALGEKIRSVQASLPDEMISELRGMFSEKMKEITHV